MKNHRNENNKQNSRDPVRDKLALVAAAIALTVVILGTFALTEHFQLSPQWGMVALISGGFFTVTGWPFRQQFRSLSFSMFYIAWFVLQAALYLLVTNQYGWEYWVMVLFVELFGFFLTAYWLFGLHPPNPNKN